LFCHVVKNSLPDGREISSWKKRQFVRGLYLNVIQVACDLRLLDLIHLSGHFGISKVDPNAVIVPDATDNK
jgi:hypothetical protein